MLQPVYSPPEPRSPLTPLNGTLNHHIYIKKKRTVLQQFFPHVQAPSNVLPPQSATPSRSDSKQFLASRSLLLINPLEEIICCKSSLLLLQHANALKNTIKSCNCTAILATIVRRRANINRLSRNAILNIVNTGFSCESSPVQKPNPIRDVSLSEAERINCATLPKSLQR